METIGERIERLRKEAKIAAGDLAKAAGVSLSALRQLEKNVSKNPKPETLLGIARRLGRSMEEIVEPGAAPARVAPDTEHPRISAQALHVALWFDSLSKVNQQKAIGQMLMSLQAVPDDYVERFLPLPPGAAKTIEEHEKRLVKAKS